MNEVYQCAEDGCHVARKAWGLSKSLVRLEFMELEYGIKGKWLLVAPSSVTTGPRIVTTIDMLIGGEVWWDKEKKIKWSNMVMFGLSLTHAYLLWIYWTIVDAFLITLYMICKNVFKKHLFDWMTYIGNIVGYNPAGYRYFYHYMISSISEDNNEQTCKTLGGA